MRRPFRLSAGLLVVVMLALPGLCSEPCLTEMDGVVERFRKIIVVTQDQGQDAAIRERAKVVGWLLFQRNQEALARLTDVLREDLNQAPSAKLRSFLERLEDVDRYRDADKLAFRELVEDLNAGAPSGSPLKRRLEEDLTALDRIQAMYQKEMGNVLAQFQTRAMPVRREAWAQYLRFLNEAYSREKILKEYEPDLPPAETRGGTRKRNPSELFGSEFPRKTLLLTFDDGPHPRYTSQILETLKKYGVPAVFFEVGRNLGTIDKSGNVKLSPGAAVSSQVLASGSTLGNHTFSHPVLPKLEAAAYTREIEETNSLIAAIMKSEPTVFRPPYGASNDAILSVTQSRNMKSLIWNIDSLDWADPVPSSITQRVLKEVQQYGRGIILFHDIHKRTAELLPELIEKLQADGYTFVSWNGNGIGSEKRGLEQAENSGVSANSYRESWAVVIGIDEYEHWPKLRYAAHDAQSVRDALVQKFKFKPENVFLLLNGEATRQNILSLLGDKLADTDMVKRDDRVFVFFAGHGATRKLPSGRELGYVIPVDAGLSSYQGQAISMTNFQDIAESIPAKHLFFVMDSCYSGLALTRGGSAGPSRNYLQEIARRDARQIFTAGGADQQVADNGPNGHSIFTWTLLQGLDGRGDLNADGVITATELAAYVSPAVSALSQQTPAFGSLAGSQGGDFIFDLRHESEFLNADSAQLGDEAIRLNAELARLREQNERLQRELAAANSRLQKAPAPKAALAVSPAAALNDEGMRLYKEKDYAGALLKFTEAAEKDSTSALFANNAGFALYRVQRYQEAADWFERAIKLDPQRAVAYLNLADAWIQLGRLPDARRSYERYLELVPTGKGALQVREKLAAIDGAAGPAAQPSK